MGSTSILSISGAIVLGFKDFKIFLGEGRAANGEKRGGIDQSSFGFLGGVLSIDIRSLGVIEESSWALVRLQLLSDYYCWKDYADREGINIDWRTRILTKINYDLWEVIVNGDSPPPKRTVDGVEQTYPPTTTKEKLARKNELKARGTLLMALLNEHQLKFNTYKCAKTLMEAIEKRFGGNKESKKTQKTLLKQHQLEILGESISQEDMNLKFLRCLPSEWKTHTLIWRNKPDLDTLSMDDLYNNLKIYETEVKGSSISNKNSQNVAFVSSNNSGSSNQAYGSISANTDNISDAVIYSFFANQSNSPQLNDEDLQQIDTDDLEGMDLKWPMAMLTMRARRFLNKTGRKINANGSETIGLNKSKAEEGPTNFALMAYTSSGSLSSSSSDSESQLNVGAYKAGLESVKARLDAYKKNEIVFEEDIKVLKLDINDKFKTGVGFDSQVVDSQVFDSQENDRYKTSEGYHVVPRPYTGNFMPSKYDLVLADEEEYVFSESFCQSFYSINGNLQLELQEKGVINNGCSRHMTGNKSYLSDYEEIDGGFVALRGNPKGGRITGKGKISTGKLDFEDVYFVKELKFNLFSVSQMCDKKNSVLFTDTECVVLSPDFKLLDENHVLLRVPRKDNMYSVDLKNIVPSGGLTCLFAKATLDESRLWHRRLGHINFKTLNKLVRGNLVRGLPSKIFENNHTCVACQKGKQHKASCKTKTVSSISQPLQMLHMDLFGPTFVKSLMKKVYCLVVTDDYSRFSWVFFLATKDETSEILKTFITGIENLIYLKVKVIRCDNGTEFKNKVMNQLCDMKGIKREFSAKAVNTACYVQNRVLVIKPHNKTPYELLLGRKPALSFIRPFGYSVTILNTLDHLGKFDGKADEGFFVGYSTNSKAYRVFNSRTMIVEENLYVKFREETPNIAGNRPNWLFDIDALIMSMNYKPVVTGNQTNGNAGTKENIDAGQDGKKIVPDQKYILLPLLISDPLLSKSLKDSPNAGFKPSGVEENMDYEHPENEDSEVPNTKEPKINQKQDANVNNTNNINIVSPTVNAADIKNNNADKNIVYGCIDDPNMPNLEEIVYSDDDEEVGAEANMNNLATNVSVNPIPTTRVHKDHPLKQIIGDIQSTPQTRRMTKSVTKYDETVIKEWEDRMGRAATTASSLEAEQDSGNINRTQSITILNESFPQRNDSGSGPRCQDTILGGAEAQIRFEGASKQSNDPPLSRVNKLGTLVDKKKVIITETSIRSDLKMDDAAGIDCLPIASIFVKLERMGTMASAIICLATNQTFNFSTYIFDNMVKHLKGEVKFLMYPKFVQVFLDKQVQGMTRHKEVYVTPSHTKKVFANMKRPRKGFSGRVTPLFPTMMIQASEDMGEDSTAHSDSHSTPIISQPLSSKPKKKKSSLTCESTWIWEKAKTLLKQRKIASLKKEIQAIGKRRK
ncbi:putative ribonuclease H-like domain-containing protein [Tanacetum coccineum]